MIKMQSKYLKICSLLLLLVIAYSCSEPSGPKTYPAPVTELLATSIDSTTVSIKWHPSTTESDAAFDRYVVTIAGTDGFTRIDTILRVSNPYQVSRLKPDVVYRFDVNAMIRNGDLSEKTSVVWSPAFRFTDLTTDKPIRIYEADRGDGSGLDLFNPENQMARVLHVDSAIYWNLGLMINDSAYFGAPKLLNYNYNDAALIRTEITDYYFDMPSMNLVYTPESLVKGNFSECLINLTAIEPQIKSNLILIVRTMEIPFSDWNYAKVLIRKNGEKLIQGSGNNRFIECEISYQKIRGIPYAKKPIH